MHINEESNSLFLSNEGIDFGEKDNENFEEGVWLSPEKEEVEYIRVITCY